MRLRQLATASALCCIGIVAFAGTASAAPVKVTTVVSHLDNPRDLAFSPRGGLYVAEAGHGGKRCITGGEMGTVCFGFTSKISRVLVSRHGVRRVVTGIVSAAAKDGTGATGVDGLSIRGPRAIYGILTGAPQQVPSSAFTASFRARIKAQLGLLIKARTNGSWRAVGSVGRRDYRWSSHHKNLVPGQFPDANPYGVIALRRNVRYVVDAGSNTLDRIGRDRRVHVLKFFPNPPSSDAVPTCIDRGPDGALYIGELTGGGNVPGSARVWRWKNGHLTVWARGLTAVTGCGFGRHGQFFAVEFSTKGLDNATPGTGALVRVPPHSTSPVPLVTNLNFPGGFAAGARGALYLSNWSIAPARSKGGAPTGQVLRITGG